MHPTLALWDRAELGARSDEVLEVYAAAMEVPLSTALSRRGILLAHLDRAELAAVAATEDGRLVGIAYGYRGEAGQWWHDQVARALSREQRRAWLRDAFEVCELHVRPERHGSGLGRHLLETLLAQTSAATAVLTTPDLETRARRFYRAGGWQDLAVDLQFPGDPRTFAVLGLQLA